MALDLCYPKPFSFSHGSSFRRSPWDGPSGAHADPLVSGCCTCGCVLGFDALEGGAGLAVAVWAAHASFLKTALAGDFAKVLVGFVSGHCVS